MTQVIEFSNDYSLVTVIATVCKVYKVVINEIEQGWKLKVPSIFFYAFALSLLSYLLLLTLLSMDDIRLDLLLLSRDYINLR